MLMRQRVSVYSIKVLINMIKRKKINNLVFLKKKKLKLVKKKNNLLIINQLLKIGILLKEYIDCIKKELKSLKKRYKNKLCIKYYKNIIYFIKLALFRLYNQIIFFFKKSKKLKISKIIKFIKIKLNFLIKFNFGSLYYLIMYYKLLVILFLRKLSYSVLKQKKNIYKTIKYFIKLRIFLNRGDNLLKLYKTKNQYIFFLICELDQLKYVLEYLKKKIIKKKKNKKINKTNIFFLFFKKQTLFFSYSVLKNRNIEERIKKKKK